MTIPCRNEPPDMWFSEDPVEIAEAQMLCQQCPIMFECRVLGGNEVYGVWGGVQRGGSKKVRRDVRCAYVECQELFTPKSTRTRFCCPSHQEKQKRRESRQRAA